MTPRAQGKEWAEKEVYKRLSDGWSGDAFAMGSGEAVDMLTKEHARAVRIVKATRKGVPSEPCEAWKDGYMTACDDILTALQRGRGGRG